LSSSVSSSAACSDCSAGAEKGVPYASALQASTWCAGTCSVEASTMSSPTALRISSRDWRTATETCLCVGGGRGVGGGEGVRAGEEVRVQLQPAAALFFAALAPLL